MVMADSVSIDIALIGLAHYISNINRLPYRLLQLRKLRLCADICVNMCADMCV